MLSSVAGLLLLVAAPEIPVRPGAEIVFDGKVEEAEWADAFSIESDHPDGGKVRFRLKRNGPWLAIALDGKGPYRGEVLRVYTSGAAGAWVTNLLFPIGQPAMPPAFWRRMPPGAFEDPKAQLGEPPRACRVRLNLGSEKSWSVEYLLRLSALGIGRGEQREVSALFELDIVFPEPKRILSLPKGVEEPFNAKLYGKLVTPDGWGSTEKWAPVPPEVSREFDDHELLNRYFAEHENTSAETPVERLVIAQAVWTRSIEQVNRLRSQLDAARARNPTLPGWSYFMGHLLHQANLYDEARKIIESVPAHLATLDQYATRAAKHYHDTEMFQKSLDLVENPRTLRAREITRLSLNGLNALAAEKAAIVLDDAKKNKNPRIRLVTQRGDVVCELFEDDAPNAVRNIMDLILQRKYYNQLSFGVVGAQAVQMGDPRTRPGASGTDDGPKWRLRADESKRPLLRGYLATVPVDKDELHGSQFLISLAPLLPAGERVTVFGRVVEGRDVLETLEQGDRLERVEVISKRNHSYDPSDARDKR